MAQGYTVDAASIKFDEPDAAPSAGGGVAVDPSAIKFDDDEAAAAAPVPKPTGGSSFLRGAGQGFTLGFGDEITGALESAFSDKTYAEARDEARAKNTAAQGAHPWLYGGGQVAGGVASALVPGLGAARVATLGGAALRGAATGGLAALGGTDADLATEEGRGQAAKEVAAGAIGGGVLGAVGHGAGKWLAAAPARAENAELAGLKEGIQNSTKVRNLGRPGAEAAARAVLKEEGAIKSAIRSDPKRALELVEAKTDALGKRLGSIYEQVQRRTPGAGVSLEKVDAALAAAAEEYAGVATRGQRNAINKLRKTFVEEFGGESPGGGMVPVTALHREVSQFAKQGFEGGPMFSVPVARQLKRDVSSALRDLLQNHVDEISSGGKIPGVSLKILQQTNAKFGAWRTIENLLEEKVTRQAATAPTMGQMLGELSPRKLLGRAVAKAADPLDRLLAPAVKALPAAAAAAPLAGRRALSGLVPTIPGTARAALDYVDDEEPEAYAAGD